MSNIISLTNVRDQLGVGKKCEHKRFLIDEAKSEVECEQCGEKLNPMWVMAKMAREESQLSRYIEEMKKLRETLEKKKHTKCQHCQRMTRVRT